ncbi:hypothetical protein DLAC_04371 [Tieghemostelium lacteum]|uniref:Uncharacterized protein n=1 Tax=Tieghemostelium lacteum TaxID=361077 RepID=A0A151ZJB5_TIELA|nr:hypothetical protein DLAC_04371 [Tieghemostelium lacteum]|eukprot:KYQ94091.1 hypothetical protein DLAC_04371 [Tieghemostelium lacteum]
MNKFLKNKNLIVGTYRYLYNSRSNYTLPIQNTKLYYSTQKHNHQYKYGFSYVNEKKQQQQQQSKKNKHNVHQQQQQRQQEFNNNESIEVPKFSFLKIMGMFFGMVIKGVFRNKMSKYEYSDFHNFTMKVAMEHQRPLIESILGKDVKEPRYQTCQLIPKDMFQSASDQVMMVYEFPISKNLANRPNYYDHSNNITYDVSSVHLVALGNQLPDERITNSFPMSLISPYKTVKHVDPLRVTLLLDLESQMAMNIFSMVPMKKEIPLYDAESQNNDNEYQDDIYDQSEYHPNQKEQSTTIELKDSDYKVK